MLESIAQSFSAKSFRITVEENHVASVLAASLPS
jgi:hypothetical protein